MRRFSAFVLVICCLLTASTALAATPAGKAVGVDPSATVANTKKTLVVGSDVSIGDKIVTGPSGQVQLVFNDDTHLVVGPSSSLVVQSYLLRTDKSVGKFAVNALGGSFRFITGKSDHDVYSINTPTGTIGVRGTAFDWTTAPQSQTSVSADPNRFLPGTVVALFRGSVILCNLAGKCVTLNNKCDAGVIATDKASTIGAFPAVDLQMRARFRYIQSEKPLLPEFRIKELRLCFRDTNPPANGLPSTFHGPAAPPTRSGSVGVGRG